MGGRQTERPTPDARVLEEGDPGANLDLLSCQEIPSGSQLTQGDRHPKDLECFSEPRA